MREVLKVLLEDNHLLAVMKPVGIPTMGAAADRPSLVALAKAYLKERYNKPGNVFLGVVSRLDAPVSGIVLFARTSKAAGRLAEQFRRRSVQKTYWALVPAAPHPAAGELTTWIGKDSRRRRVHAVSPHAPQAREARLSYKTLSAGRHGALLEITLKTGRKHQIRLQLARLGLPILGDRKYGSRHPFGAGIALHARSLAFDHPTRLERIMLVAPLPGAWRHMDVHEPG